MQISGILLFCVGHHASSAVGSPRRAGVRRGPSSVFQVFSGSQSIRSSSSPNGLSRIGQEIQEEIDEQSDQLKQEGLKEIVDEVFRNPSLLSKLSDQVGFDAMVRSCLSQPSTTFASASPCCLLPLPQFGKGRQAGDDDGKEGCNDS